MRRTNQGLAHATAATTPSLDEVLAVGNDAFDLQIKGVADPTDLQDAANKAYVDNAVAGSLPTLAQVLANNNDAATHTIEGLGEPVNTQDAATKNYVDTALFDAIEDLAEAIEFVIDGSGAVITTGIKGDLEVPFDCIITAVRLFADQAGSIVVNIWKDTYANFPPTVADKITSTTPPTITATNKAQDSALTSWNTTINSGDILRFNVDSVTTIQRVTLSITVLRQL